MKELKTEHGVAKKVFRKMDFKVLAHSEGTKNGPDMWVLKNGRVYTVEIKKAKPQAGNNFQVRPVGHNRNKDDFICVVFPSGYCFIEPMKDHLKSCSVTGVRNLHGYS